MTARSLNSVTRQRMRAVAEGTMADRCAIVRDTQVSDNAGGYTITTTTGATIRCGVRALNSINSGSEQAIADRLGWSVGYAIRVPLGTDITPSDRIVVNGTRTFEVGAVIAGASTAIAITAICQEVG